MGITVSSPACPLRPLLSPHEPSFPETESLYMSHRGKEWEAGEREGRVSGQKATWLHPLCFPESRPPLIS